MQWMNEAIQAATGVEHKMAYLKKELGPDYKPPFPEQQPETVGMGGAKLGEVAVKGNPDIHGVNNAVREEMAKSGRAVPPVSGEGISAEDSVRMGPHLMDALQDKASHRNI